MKVLAHWYGVCYTILKKTSNVPDVYPLSRSGEQVVDFCLVMGSGVRKPFEVAVCGGDGFIHDLLEFRVFCVRITPFSTEDPHGRDLQSRRPRAWVCGRCRQHGRGGSGGLRKGSIVSWAQRP